MVDKFPAVEGVTENIVMKILRYHLISNLNCSFMTRLTLTTHTQHPHPPNDASLGGQLVWWVESC